MSIQPKSHILVIEDEEGLRFLLESKLLHLGYNVSVAATGRHGLQKIKSGTNFDLILCDLKMPGMDGLELFKEYKSGGGTSPFVILTGYPDKAKIVEAVQLGVQDVILKPVKHGELMGKIDTFVALSKSRSSTPVAA